MCSGPPLMQADEKAEHHRPDAEDKGHNSCRGDEKDRQQGFLATASALSCFQFTL